MYSKLQMYCFSVNVTLEVLQHSCEIKPKIINMDHC